jgi:hypothetical protein
VCHLFQHTQWQERPVIVLPHGTGDFVTYRFRYALIAHRCNWAGFNAAIQFAGAFFAAETNAD